MKILWEIIMIKKAKNTHEVNTHLKKLSKEFRFMTPWSQKEGESKKPCGTSRFNDKSNNREPFKQYITAESRSN